MARQVWTVEAVNDRLRAGHHPVRVQKRGEKLVLRATLPPKPGEQRKQHRIPVAPHSLEGLKIAEVQAYRLSSELTRGVFQWSEWERDRGDDRPELVKVLEAFKAHQFLFCLLTMGWLEDCSDEFEAVDQQW